MTRRQVSGAVIRDAIVKLLGGQSMPTSTQELVTAVYHYTGEDRVGHGNVTAALRVLLAEGAVERVDRGMWRAVQS